MQFRFTEVFAAAYDALDDADALLIDEVILRITDEHDQAWARQNRVVGEAGEAWLVVSRSAQGEFKIYWTYMDEDLVVFLALLLV
jgi:hypothetical protein